MNAEDLDILVSYWLILMILSLRESITLQTSAVPILLEGSYTSIWRISSTNSLEKLLLCGTLIFAFIYASFSPGTKGDLKYINVYMMQPRPHMSTFSVIWKPEYKSSYSGALYIGVVVFSISSYIASQFYQLLIS